MKESVRSEQSCGVGCFVHVWGVGYVEGTMCVVEDRAGERPVTLLPTATLAGAELVDEEFLRPAELSCWGSAAPSPSPDSFSPGWGSQFAGHLHCATCVRQSI